MSGLPTPHRALAMPCAWADVRSPQFLALDPQRTVALLPLGATEQHGPHLPLGVDTCIVEGMVGAALGRLAPATPVLRLPTQALGYSPEHADFAGTISPPIEALIAQWVAVGAGVARAGLKKLLMFNAHGGNVAVMDIVARELRMRHGLTVFHSSWWNLPLGAAYADAFGAHELRFGAHGGATETALMLALQPHSVDMDAAERFSSRSEQRAAICPVLGDGRSAKLGWAAQDYNPAGATGDAASATAAQGQALLDAAAQALARLLNELVELPLTAFAQTADQPTNR